MQVFLVTAACALLYMLNNGLRSNFGLIASALNIQTGLSMETISFAQAVAQLLYGVTQPLWGILALKKSNSYVLGFGGVLMAAGLMILSFCRSGWLLMLSLGVMVGFAAGALAFGVVMGAVTPVIDKKYAAAVSGVINGSCGLGGAILAPALQWFMDAGQFEMAMVGLSCVAVCGVLVCVWLNKKETDFVSETETDGAAPSIRELLKEAFTSSRFWHLSLAFFTCGFYMTVIETFLYPQLISYGYDGSRVAFLFTIYGVMGMVGPLITGFLSGIINPKWVLGTTYGLRPIFIALFFLLPQNMVTVYIYVIGLGLTGAATVAPTTLLIGKFFGNRKMPTLSGIAMVFHQMGSFLSIWLGSRFITFTGNYLPIWVCSGILAVTAAGLCYSIKE